MCCVIKIKMVVAQSPVEFNGSHILKAKEEKELFVSARWPSSSNQASWEACKLSGVWIYYEA